MGGTTTTFSSGRKGLGITFRSGRFFKISVPRRRAQPQREPHRSSLDHGIHNPSGVVFYLQLSSPEGPLKIESLAVNSQGAITGLIFGYSPRSNEEVYIQPPAGTVATARFFLRAALPCAEKPWGHFPDRTLPQQAPIFDPVGRFFKRNNFFFHTHPFAQRIEGCINPYPHFFLMSSPKKNWMLWVPGFKLGLEKYNLLKGILI